MHNSACTTTTPRHTVTRAILFSFRLPSSFVCRPRVATPSSLLSRSARSYPVYDRCLLLFTPVPFYVTFSRREVFNTFANETDDSSIDFPSQDGQMFDEFCDDQRQETMHFSRLPYFIGILRWNPIFTVERKILLKVIKFSTDFISREERLRGCIFRVMFL